VLFACPYCGTWSVDVCSAAPEIWTGPGGERVSCVRNRCGACRTVILTEPTELAVEATRDRKASARDAMRVVAGE
jgi:hypothetical protein